MKHVRVQTYVVMLASLVVMLLLGTYVPAYAGPDCDANPTAPICGGEGAPKPLYKRLYLKSYTGTTNYVDFYYNTQNQVLSWSGKTYLGCFAYKTSYVTTYGVTTLKIRFNREFLLPPSWSQLCGNGGYTTITTTGSRQIYLTVTQQNNFSSLFEGNDIFIGQG